MDWAEKKIWDHVLKDIMSVFFTLTMINNSSFILSDVCWKVKRQSSENESVSVVLVMTSWRNRLHSPQLLTHSSLPSHEISNITVCWNVPYMKYVTWKVVISLTSFCESFVFLFLVGFILFSRGRKTKLWGYFLLQNSCHNRKYYAFTWDEIAPFHAVFNATASSSWNR